ncbi:uncharacterized protein C8R40DRAFT_1097453 [Lentinula edodes]|uniref:uncharacterized protein n=1 Tax=Lentinula edodes TaxID=5353 RepID=UPI001E8E305E|nr:uncharacterized protein C8R40DRAFT_1097453 [Lentinula edodes]KAH7877132.1 hypothetical protein C8R40DRAFT_1097453 [Lentinula edodes]
MRGSSSSCSGLRDMPATYGLEYHFDWDSDTVFDFVSHPSTALVPDLTGCVANFDEQEPWPLPNINAVSVPASPSGFIASQISGPSSSMLEGGHRECHSGVHVNLSKMDCTDLMSSREFEPIVAVCHNPNAWWLQQLIYQH